MAGTGEYIIKIQSVPSGAVKTASKNSSQDIGLDSKVISNRIANALTRSMKQMETKLASSIEKTLKSTQSPQDRKDPTKKATTEATSANLSQEIVKALTKVVNSSSSKSKSPDKFDTKSVEAAIDKGLSSALSKLNPSNTGNIDLGPVISAIKASVPKQEVIDMSQVVRELSFVSSNMSSITKAISDLKANKGTDVAEITSLVNKLISKASQQKESLSAISGQKSVVKNIVKGEGSKEILTALNKLNSNFNALLKDSGSSTVDSGLVKILERIAASMDKSVKTYNSIAPTKIENNFKDSGTDIQKFSAVLNTFLVELKKQSPKSGRLQPLVADTMRSLAPVKDIKVDDIKISGLANINKSVSGLREAVQEIQQAFNDTVEVSVQVKSSSVTKAKKDIEDATKDRIANVTVEADTTRASVEIAKVVEDKKIGLELDINDLPIKELYTKLKDLSSNAEALTNNKLGLKVDTKQVEQAIKRLDDIVTHFDTVNAAVNAQRRDTNTELKSTIKVKESGVDRKGKPLDETSLKNITTEINILSGKMTSLLKASQDLHRSMDRSPTFQAEHTRALESDMPLPVLTVEGLANHSKSVSELTKTLNSIDLTELPLAKKSPTGTGGTTAHEGKAKVNDSVTLLKQLIKDINFKAVDPNSEKATVALEKAAKAQEKSAIAHEKSAIALNKSATGHDTVKSQRFKDGYPASPRSASRPRLQHKDKSLNWTAVADVKKNLEAKYEPKYITPGETYQSKSKNPNEYETKVFDNMNNLSTSLDGLQKSIYDSMIAGLAETKLKSKRVKPKTGEVTYYTDWKVVKQPGDSPDHQKAFTRKDRQWSMDIVDVKKLKSLTNAPADTAASPKELLATYKQLLSKGIDLDISDMKKDIAGWLQREMGTKGIGELDTKVVQTFNAELTKHLKDLGNISCIKR